MRAWCPQTTQAGDLPNISFIKRDPEPLCKPIVVCFYPHLLFDQNLFSLIGTNFKCAACTITGVVLFLEIQHGKEGMKSELHQFT
jgi:hypothetical protein